jgi:hypothetical protein
MSMAWLTESEQVEAFQKAVEIYLLRKEGLSEEEIAKKLNFTSRLVTSPGVMHGQLQRWGFPDWLVYPEGHEARRQRDETPESNGESRTKTFGQAEGPDHCEKPAGGQSQAKVDSGALVKLPPANAARDLFLDALECLKTEGDSLDIEEDWLWGDKRYITAWVDRDVYKVIHRAECSKKEWEELCERHGANPEETDAVDVRTVESSPAGLNRTPPGELAALVAAYVFSPDGLKRRPLEPLLEALHPEPAVADKEQLRAKIEELERVAGHVAMLVRGGTVGSGHPIDEVSRSKHFLAWHIQQLDPEGTSSEEEMLELLRDSWGEDMDAFTPKDIRWLRSLRLPRPE